MSDPLKDNTNTTRDKYDGKGHTEAERERGLAELDDAVRETWRERDATLLELKKMRQARSIHWSPYDPVGVVNAVS